MTEKRRVRPRLGDVVRVRAVDGRAAYAQFTHKHPTYGALVRILGRAPEEATPLGDEPARAIAGQTTQFLTFFPLGAACARGIAEIIGCAPIPEELRAFPTFRRAELQGLPAFGSEGRQPWWLWDGERDLRLEERPSDFAQYPILEIVNDTLLVERAHGGWRHDSAPD